MIVILCHPDDGAALWLADTLIELGVPGIEVVSVEQLVFSRRIVHRMRQTGDAGIVQLADGRTLRPEGIRGLINRVRYLPTHHFAAADPEDRAYATAELHAFLLAWINSAGGRVINPARPLALDGGSFPSLTLRHFAAMAGLPSAVLRATASGSDDGWSEGSLPTHSSIVVDSRIFGPLLPRSLQDGCRRLAALLGIPLLQVSLHQSRHDGWRFVDATGLADFRVGGRAHAAWIAKALAA